MGEPGITGCNAMAVRSSRLSDIYLESCGVRACSFVDYRCVNVFIIQLIFLQQYFPCCAISHDSARVVIAWALRLYMRDILATREGVL